MSDGAGRLFVFGFLTSLLCLVAFHVRDGLLEGIAQNGDRASDSKP